MDKDLYIERKLLYKFIRSKAAKCRLTAWHDEQLGTKGFLVDLNKGMLMAYEDLEKRLSSTGFEVDEV